MKLLLCPECQDVVRLFNDWRTCRCGRVRGRYVNDRLAEYAGPAVPLGFHNGSLLEAMQAWLSTEGKAAGNFTAFTIAPDCPTFRKVDEVADAGSR